MENLVDRTLIASCLSLMACGVVQPTTVPRPPSDATPPTVKIVSVLDDSAHLPEPILVSSDPAVSARAKARARRDARFVLRAQANDPESGVRSLTLEGRSYRICGKGVTGPFHTPIRQAEVDPDPAPQQVPVERTEIIWVDVPAERAQCSDSLLSYYVELRATAENYLGGRVTSPTVEVYHVGRDFIRVATFNIGGTQRVGTLPGETFNPLTAVAAANSNLQRWGQGLLRSADIVLLQEIDHDDWVKILVEHSGLPYWYKHGADLAIVSRFPLYDTTWYELPPPGEDRKLLVATASIGGVAHRIVDVHWTHRPLRYEESPNRLASAQKVVDLLQGETRPVFFGGDLNTCQPTVTGELCVERRKDLPDILHPATGKEWALLTTSGGLTDAFRMVPNADPCDPARIDYVFYRGPYKPTQYLADCLGQHPTTNEPSDHGFILVWFAQLTSPSFEPLPPPSRAWRSRSTTR
jgi:hypothetical protein